VIKKSNYAYHDVSDFGINTTNFFYDVRGSIFG